MSLRDWWRPRRCISPDVCMLAERILKACDKASQDVWQHGGVTESVDVYVTPWDQFELRVHHIDKMGNECVSNFDQRGIHGEDDYPGG